MKSSRFTFADQILSFYSQLKIDAKLPKGVGVLNPYQNKEAFEACKIFYHRYYNDDNTRAIILGINPGRFGGGLTGIPFIDPIKLEQLCGIENSFVKKPELSADFILRVIQAFGGLEKFYQKFYINSVSPLGFVFEEKNLNYYDTPALLRAVEPFILKSIQKQIDFGIRKDIAYCLGEGANFKYLSGINQKWKFFDQIIPLAHPRFVMQYKRKFMEEFVNDYLGKLRLTT